MEHKSLPADFDRFQVLRASSVCLADSRVAETVDLIWDGITSPLASLDEEYRVAAMEIFRSIWGLEMPFASAGLGRYRAVPKSIVQKKTYDEDGATSRSSLLPSLDMDMSSRAGGLKISIKMSGQDSIFSSAPAASSSKKKVRLPPAPPLDPSQIAREEDHVELEDDFDDLIDEGSNWVNTCINIVDRLADQHYAEPFLHPVDLKAIPHYTTLVPYPMDLSTVKRKLQASMYSSFDHFAGEINLIWENCRTFNCPGSVIYLYADKMDRFFQRLCEFLARNSSVESEDYEPVSKRQKR
eukprot:GILI01024287.1.p2 GENE.GILI01024287.1~~GILI01024287.1.p2  ORF type:complete len:297 (-),score=72.47 GILI01024287.1:70-960(-)